MSQDEPPPPRVYVFFDYNCPWSYVGKLRADRLLDRLELELVWCGWELHPTLAPEGWPTPGVQGVATDPVEGPMGKLAAELEERLYWPPTASNTNLALRGLEHAKDQGTEEAASYHEAVFHAIWQEGRNVGDREVLAGIAQEVGMDPGGFLEAIDHPAYGRRLEAVDQKAEDLALVRRPSFVFGDHRIAGTDAFEPSLLHPIEAFTERWRRDGLEGTTTLEEDWELEVLR